MDTITFVGALFVSVAVIITVAGELAHIAEFFGIKKLKFHRPRTAFLALLAVIFLLSAIVTTSVVAGADASILANEIATFAVFFSFLPWLLEVISLVREGLLPIAIFLFILGIAVLVSVFPERSLLDAVSPLLPLAVVLIFACIPLVSSYDFSAKEEAK